jgi:hypothetical protein
MKLEQKKVIIGIGILLGVVGVYLFLQAYKKNHVLNKDAAIALIAKTFGLDPKSLASFDSLYLINRANAILNSEATFTNLGKKYLTANGRAI